MTFSACRYMTATTKTLGRVLFLFVFICYTSAHQIPRNEYGRIKRNAATVRQFKQQTGYPKGRTGYVVDHIIPLKRGGCDSVGNMQWQTTEEAKEKDKWE